MAWTVKFDQRAEKELARLDRAVQRRVLKFLHQRVEGDCNPRDVGKPLQGEMSGLWRYRVGDYRLICQIQDAALMVLVIRLAHKRDVYR